MEVAPSITVGTTVMLGGGENLGLGCKIAALSSRLVEGHPSPLTHLLPLLPLPVSWVAKGGGVKEWRRRK